MTLHFEMVVSTSKVADLQVWEDSPYNIKEVTLLKMIGPLHRS